MKPALILIITLLCFSCYVQSESTWKCEMCKRTVEYMSNNVWAMTDDALSALERTDACTVIKDKNGKSMSKRRCHGRFRKLVERVAATDMIYGCIVSPNKGALKHALAGSPIPIPTTNVYMYPCPAELLCQFVNYRTSFNALNEPYCPIQEHAPGKGPEVTLQKLAYPGSLLPFFRQDALRTMLAKGASQTHIKEILDFIYKNRVSWARRRTEEGIKGMLHRIKSLETNVNNMDESKTIKLPSPSVSQKIALNLLNNNELAVVNALVAYVLSSSVSAMKAQIETANVSPDRRDIPDVTELYRAYQQWYSAAQQSFGKLRLGENEYQLSASIQSQLSKELSLLHLYQATEERPNLLKHFVDEHGDKKYQAIESFAKDMGYANYVDAIMWVVHNMFERVHSLREALNFALESKAKIPNVDATFNKQGHVAPEEMYKDIVMALERLIVDLQ